MATNILLFKLPVNRRSAASIKAKIAEIDVLIDELFNSAMKSVSTGNIMEYDLDTGQTKTKIKYTSVSSVVASIEDYEKLRQMYVNMLNGSTGVHRLIDERNTRRR
jgi:hypothetical protein